MQYTLKFPDRIVQKLLNSSRLFRQVFACGKGFQWMVMHITGIPVEEELLITGIA